MSFLSTAAKVGSTLASGYGAVKLGEALLKKKKVGTTTAAATATPGYEQQWAQKTTESGADETKRAGQMDASGANWDAASQAAGAFTPGELQKTDTKVTANTGDLANYEAAATKGVDPSQLTQWRATNLAGVNTGALKDFKSQALAGMGGVAEKLRGFQSGNLANENFADVSGFDPMQYGKEYASGAMTETKNWLGDELDALKNQSVARGRFDTGLFERDQGRTMQRVMSDFNSKIAQAATTFSGQRGDMLKSGAQMRLQRAGQMDENSLAAALKAGDIDLTAARDIDANALDALKAGSDLDLRRAGQMDELYAGNERTALSAALDRAKTMDTLGLDAKSTAAKLDLDAATTSSRNALDRATNIDKITQDAGQFAAGQAGDRARMDSDNWNKSADRSRDMIAAGWDRNIAQQNQRAANRQAGWQTGINAAGTVADALGAIKGKSGLRLDGNTFSNAAKNVGGAVSAAKGAWDWGKKGAAIGSVIPGVGTIVGGAIGGVAGALKGLFGRKKR